jgi:hypothetical protein
MKYFSECKTQEEVKAEFKRLAKINHPDKGGNVEIMQMINAAYSIAIKRVLSGSKFTDEEVESEILSAEAYKNAVQSIINIEGIIIELCGSYIWVTPLETDNFWSFWPEMKKAGYLFAKVKKQFYFRTEEHSSKGNTKTLSSEQIASKYGRRVINAGSYKANYLN